MKRILKSSVAIGLAFSMIGGPLAMAQSDQHGQGGGQNAPHADQMHPTGPQQHMMAHTTLQHGNAGMGEPNNTMPHQMMQPSHEQQRPAPQHQPMRYSSGGGHHWQHGDHYTGGRDYVTDYHRYHLNAPPPGYQWVQNGGTFLLIAVGSGIIADVILQSFNQ